MGNRLDRHIRLAYELYVECRRGGLLKVPGMRHHNLGDLVRTKLKLLKS